MVCVDIISLGGNIRVMALFLSVVCLCVLSGTFMKIERLVYVWHVRNFISARKNVHVRT